VLVPCLAKKCFFRFACATVLNDPCYNRTCENPVQASTHSFRLIVRSLVVVDYFAAEIFN